MLWSLLLQSAGDTAAPHQQEILPEDEIRDLPSAETQTRKHNRAVDSETGRQDKVGERREEEQAAREEVALPADLSAVQRHRQHSSEKQRVRGGHDRRQAAARQPGAAVLPRGGPLRRLHLRQGEQVRWG